MKWFLLGTVICLIIALILALMLPRKKTYIITFSATTTQLEVGKTYSFWIRVHQGKGVTLHGEDIIWSDITVRESVGGE